MVKKVLDGESIIALVVYSSFSKEGIEFFTPGDFSQQLGYMNRPAGYEIAPHTHNLVSREISYTQETLFIRSGKLQVDLFSNDRKFLESVVLGAGDVILLAGGGHGFTFLEQSEVIEVKQGPYLSLEVDKTRFSKPS